MSQEAVERFLGRMLAARRFRILVGESLESASWREGFLKTTGFRPSPE